MLITLGTVLVVVMLPATLTTALLLLAGWRERARERAVVRQIAVTEAIDAELRTPRCNGPIRTPRRWRSC